MLFVLRVVLRIKNSKLLEIWFIVKIVAFVRQLNIWESILK